MTGVSPLRFTALPDRGVLAVTGEDRVKYLQGLVSNDVRLVSPERAVYAWLMTPQGKYLHDFIIYETGEALLLDVEADRRADLLRRMKMYRLRSQIALEDRTDSLSVTALYGDGATAAAGLENAARGAVRPVKGGLAAVDPRRDGLGVRLILPRDGAAAIAAEIAAAAGAAPADFAAYDLLRLSLGVADGVRDLVPEKSVALENDMDALGALSWDKGCYMGQELTARTKYRGLIKKQLIPVRVDGPLPDAGTPITRGGRDAGELRSGRDGLALALLRLDEVEAAADEPEIPFIAGDARLYPLAAN